MKHLDDIRRSNPFKLLLFWFEIQFLLTESSLSTNTPLANITNKSLIQEFSSLTRNYSVDARSSEQLFTNKNTSISNLHNHDMTVEPLIELNSSIKVERKQTSKELIDTYLMDYLNSLQTQLLTQSNPNQIQVKVDSHSFNESQMADYLDIIQSLYELSNSAKSVVGPVDDNHDVSAEMVHHNQDDDFVIDEALSLYELEPEDNSLRNTLLLIGYSVIVLVSLAGNLLVCRVIYSTPKLRTTTNILIFSLTMSDIITTVFNIPFNCARIMLHNWPFPDFFCVLMPTVQVSSVYVSTITMAAIGVHRYRSVRITRVKRVSKTTRIHTTNFTTSPYVSRTKITILIVFIWIGSIILALPHSAFNQVVDGVFFNSIRARRCRAVYPKSLEEYMPLLLSIESTLTQFLIPLSITCILYGKIAKIIQRQGQLAQHFCDELNRRMCEAKRKRVMMLILVVVTFVLSWLPLTTYHLLNDLHILPFNYSVFLILHQLAMSSVCYNPFIYCFMNEDFRNKAKKVLGVFENQRFLCWMFTRSRPSSSPSRPLTQSSASRGHNTTQHTDFTLTNLPSNNLNARSLWQGIVFSDLEPTPQSSLPVNQTLIDIHQTHTPDNKHANSALTKIPDVTVRLDGTNTINSIKLPSPENTLKPTTIFQPCKLTQFPLDSRQNNPNTAISTLATISISIPMHSSIYSQPGKSNSM